MLRAHLALLFLISTASIPTFVGMWQVRLPEIIDWSEVDELWSNAPSARPAV